MHVTPGYKRAPVIGEKFNLVKHDHFDGKHTQRKGTEGEGGGNGEKGQRSSQQ